MRVVKQLPHCLIHFFCNYLPFLVNIFETRVNSTPPLVAVRHLALFFCCKTLKLESFLNSHFPAHLRKVIRIVWKKGQQFNSLSLSLLPKIPSPISLLLFVYLSISLFPVHPISLLLLSLSFSLHLSFSLSVSLSPSFPLTHYPFLSLSLFLSVSLSLSLSLFSAENKQPSKKTVELFSLKLDVGCWSFKSSSPL